jgi:sRNA-binding regulator protein Hfq
MKSLKVLLTVFIFMLFSRLAKAQDVVFIDSVNNVRGTIKGTDFFTVTLEKDDKSQVVYKAKDVQEFLWNGDTYVSKSVMNKNKMEARFFKVVEMGAVNLYSIGEGSQVEPKQSRVRVMPEVGIGIGGGGYGGFGLGGGISIGGGGRRSENTKVSRRALYFIDKPGSGPMQEIQFNAGNSKERIREILLSKLNNDEDLAERIKDTDTFDAKNVAAFVKAYNVMHK